MSAPSSEAIERPLYVDDQAAISTRIAATMLGTGLLGVGLLHEWIAPAQAPVAELLEGLAALIVAAPIFRTAFRGFVAKPTTALTEQLVALAVLAAIVSGDFVTAVLIPLFLEVGHLFEERSAMGAQASIEELRALCVRPATLWRDGKEREVDPDALRDGDQVAIRPGELVPVDGTVRFGRASIDQSPITGESTPASVGPGDEVFSGTVNLDGMIRVEVRHAGEQTTLGQVVNLLREVEASKTPIVRIIERAAAAYLPAVLAIATIALFATGDLERFITVLVVACPCALVLAGPSAIVVAMTSATRGSILIKTASFLERIASVDTLVLDKTGTVTHGEQTVDHVDLLSDTREEDVLRIGAAVAQGSRHPSSRALVDAANANDLSVICADSIEEVPGCGVEGRVGDTTVRVGRRAWLAERGVRLGAADRTESGVWVAQDNELLGFVSLFDRTRDEAETAIRSMRAHGFDRILLLTGDRRSIADRVGAELDVDEVIAEALPSEKLEVIRNEQQAGRQVLMVGDGVNDALALSAADVGVAMGSRASQVALGGADVALLANDLSRLPFMVSLADRTRRTILQNVAIGLGFSSLMLAIASAGWINPLLGAFLHNGGAIFVVLNSSRLLTPTKE
ncbi:MAG: cation-translocating P-type ATPase [Myxococcota bacterium]